MSNVAAKIEAVSVKLADANADLTIIKEQLQNALLPADYAALVQQLSSNPAKFAVSEERKLYREAAKLLISIQQLEKQLDELKEQERLEPIFE
jgi:hypothetical protein